MEQSKHTGKAKLSIDQVVRALTELSHISARELSRRWNVSHATVNNVRQGKSWKSHVALLGLPLAKKIKETLPAEEKKTLQPTQ
jgi:hypothetical protein